MVILFTILLCHGTITFKFKHFLVTLIHDLTLCGKKGKNTHEERIELQIQTFHNFYIVVFDEVMTGSSH